MGIDEKLEKILKKLDDEEEVKGKKFRIPFGKKVGKSQAKKNYITIIKLNENGNMEFLKHRIEDQSFMVDGVPRLGLAQYVFYYKNNPFIIMPSWSVIPYNKRKESQESLADGSNTVGYQILLDRMIKETTQKVKAIGNMFKIIIGVGLAAIIGYAFITGGAT